MPFVSALPAAQLELLASGVLLGGPKHSLREYAEAALDVVSYVLGRALPDDKPDTVLFRADPGLSDEAKAELLRDVIKANLTDDNEVRPMAVNVPWSLVLKIALEVLQKLGPLVG